MFRGTQAVPLQICRTFVLHRAMPLFAKKVADSCSNEYSALLNSFTSPSHHVQHALVIQGVTLLGKPNIHVLSNEHYLALLHGIASRHCTL